MRCLAALSFLVFGVLPATAQEHLVGSWEGSLGIESGSLRIDLHLALDVDGELAGTLDSPEQNAFGLLLSDVAFDGGALSFHVPDIPGAWWEGKLDAAGGRLAGTWNQRGAIELVLEKVEVDPLVGRWEGTGDFGTVKLRIVFHVGTRADGSLGASMVSPDQSPRHISVASVQVHPDGTVLFDVPSMHARYEGRPDDTRDRIEGDFFQSGRDHKLALERIGGVAAPKRPQTPTPPFPYREEPVSYANEAAGNRLAGTLTLPPGDGTFPAVLLITGSGQQDRNETLFGHEPFLVIADKLTRTGVAVLRVDDRGVGGSTGDVIGATSEDFASDVSAGVAYLRGRADIRASAVGLVGHSEGGMIGPMVAVERGDVAFLVLLAGVGIPGDELLYQQEALLSRAAGASESMVATNLRMQTDLFRLLRGESDQQELRRKAREILVRYGGEAASTQLDTVTSAWFQYFVNYDPAPTLRRVTCPVLALDGSKDLQVPPRENLDAIAAALEAGGNEDVTVKEYPGLNHLFQHCEKGTIAEYGEIEETFAPEVLSDMAAWIGKQVGSD